MLGGHDVFDRKIKRQLAALASGDKLALPHRHAVMFNAHGERFARIHAILHDHVAGKAGIGINGTGRLGLQHSQIAGHLGGTHAHNMHGDAAIL